MLAREEQAVNQKEAGRRKKKQAEDEQERWAEALKTNQIPAAASWVVGQAQREFLQSQQLTPICVGLDL